MAGTSLAFDFSQLDRAQGLMLDLQRFSEDTEPTMAAIAHEGMQQTLRRFDDQVDPNGKAWVPSKAARLENRKTLIDTRHFRDTTFSSEATRTEARWGTNAVQGRIYQLGGDIVMPARAGTVRLRTQRDGSLLRQKVSSNLAVFARASHKLAKEVSFRAVGYTIHIIARPFLGVNAANGKTFTDLVVARYGRFLEASGLGGA